MVFTKNTFFVVEPPIPILLIHIGVQNLLHITIVYNLEVSICYTVCGMWRGEVFSRTTMDFYEYSIFTPLLGVGVTQIENMQ